MIIILQCQKLPDPISILTLLSFSSLVIYFLMKLIRNKNKMYVPCFNSNLGKAIFKN